jgi:hypothetical protein
MQRSALGRIPGLVGSRRVAGDTPVVLPLLMKHEGFHCTAEAPPSTEPLAGANGGCPVATSPWFLELPP